MFRSFRVTKYLYNAEMVQQLNQKSFYTLQSLYLFGIFLLVIFQPFHYYLGSYVFAFYNNISIALLTTALLINRSGHHFYSVLVASITTYIEISLTILYYGWDCGFHYYVLVIGPAFLVQPNCSRLFRYSGILFTVIYLIVFQQFMQTHTPHFEMSQAAESITSILNLSVTALLITGLFYYYTKASTRNESLLIDVSRELAELADTDQLTMLNNRRAMQRHLKKAVINSIHNNQPFTIAMADIDHLKQVNDQHGHQAGDAVLKTVSSIFNKNLRSNDIIFRWGGDEFLVLMNHSNEQSAYEAMEKIRKLIEETSIDIGDKEKRVTVTIGIEQYDNNLGINHCMEKADDALYAGKNRGKNRVVTASTLHKKGAQMSASKEITNIC